MKHDKDNNFFFEKIQRFEKSLELHNTSDNLAEFWNEIAEDLYFFKDFTDELQFTNYLLSSKFKELNDKSKVLDIILRNNDLIRSSNHLLFNLKIAKHELLR